MKIDVHVEITEAEDSVFIATLGEVEDLIATGPTLIPEYRGDNKGKQDWKALKWLFSPFPI